MANGQTKRAEMLSAHAAVPGRPEADWLEQAPAGLTPAPLHPSVVFSEDAAQRRLLLFCGKARRKHPAITARLAQSAERKALNLVVVGSSPTVGV